MDHLYKKQQAVSKEARKKIEEITNGMKVMKALAQSNSKEDDAWKGENDRIVNLLLTADAYAMFRHAQAPSKPAPGKKDDVRGDEEFIKLCRDALDLLRRAEALQPDQYVMLQNIGMIYGDPRFDSDNSHIGVARRYFERSTKIKPEDYFGYQNLAGLAVREVYAWGIEFADENAITNAITAANNSLQRRPGNGTVFIILAQLYAVQWSTQTGADKKKSAEAKYEASIANAKKFKARHIEFVCGL